MFTHNEKVDMLLIYGEAGKNSLAARRLYAERYPGRILPESKIFSRLENSLRKNPDAFSGKILSSKSLSSNTKIAYYGL